MGVGRSKKRLNIFEKIERVQSFQKRWPARIQHFLLVENSTAYIQSSAFGELNSSRRALASARLVKLAARWPALLVSCESDII